MNYVNENMKEIEARLKRLLDRGNWKHTWHLPDGILTPEGLDRVNDELEELLNEINRKKTLLNASIKARNALNCYLAEKRLSRPSAIEVVPEMPNPRKSELP